MGKGSEEIKSPEDRFHRLKYIAYCQSNLPPESVAASYADFVTFAKFQLCKEKHILMKDPIWERYADEEILVEYYGLLFAKNPDFKTEFEARLNNLDPEFVKWMNKEMTKTKLDLAKQKVTDSLEDGPTESDGEFEFDPKSMGDE